MDVLDVTQGENGLRVDLGDQVRGGLLVAADGCAAAGVEIGIGRIAGYVAGRDDVHRGRFGE